MCRFCTNGQTFNVFTNQWEPCSHCQKPNTPSSYGSWNVEYTKSTDPAKDVVKGTYHEYNEGQPVKKQVPIKKWWEK